MSGNFPAVGVAVAVGGQGGAGGNAAAVSVTNGAAGTSLTNDLVVTQGDTSPGILAQSIAAAAAGRATPAPSTSAC